MRERIPNARGRAAKRIAASFAAIVVGLLAVPAGTATASNASTYCDGWKIASANYVTGTDQTWGAVQLLRNYCHADGDDYVMWVGRTFLYETHNRYWGLEVFLYDAYGGTKSCTVPGNSAPNSYCTTAPMYSDITGVNSHQAKATMWGCDLSCLAGHGGSKRWGYGETARL